jgi:hypothetical protein
VRQNRNAHDKLTCTFQILLDLKVLVSVIVNAGSQSSGSVALVFTCFIVVVVATAVAVLANGIARLLERCHFCLRVRVNKINHLNDIFSASRASGARVSRTQCEPNKVLGIENTFVVIIIVFIVVVAVPLLGDLDQTAARKVLDGVLIQKSVLVLVVVILIQISSPMRSSRSDNRGLFEQLSPQRRIDRNVGGFCMRSENAFCCRAGKSC